MSLVFSEIKKIFHMMNNIFSLKLLRGYRKLHMLIMYISVYIGDCPERCNGHGFCTDQGCK